MAGRMMAGKRVGRLAGHRRLAAVVIAAGLVAPGAFVAFTPGTAGADTSDPVGTIEAQVGAVLGQVDSATITIEQEVLYAVLESSLLSGSCLTYVLTSPFGGPVVCS